MSVSPQTELQMFPTESRYSRLRWFCTIASLFLYIVDIATDVMLALKYFQEGQLLWAALTLGFVLVGVVATQIFSYAWYIDDMKAIKSGLVSVGLMSLHVLGMGILTRYMQLLRAGYQELWPATSSYAVENRSAHHRLFCLATDLSMLKLFEAFLESLPQLLLQIYLLLDHGECSLVQYASMAFSLANAAWALVDYRRCLRRSLPSVQEMPSGFPTAVYLLYKFSTITSCILAYALLLSLSTHAAAALGVLWLLGTLWAFAQRTEFCTRRTTEWVYRAAVGGVLVFTFFNVKGNDTQAPMSLYYLFHAAVNVAAPLLFALLWSPTLAPPTGEAATTVAPPTSTVAPPTTPGTSPTSAEAATELWFFWPVAGVIAAGTVVGLVCLVVYYARMHPRGGECLKGDEVDNLERSAPSSLSPEEAGAGQRMRAFLQL